MIATEDRIRDALRADAETVRPDSLRGLPDRDIRPATRRPIAKRWPEHRVLIPLTAAAAVTAIAVAAAVLVPEAGRRTTPAVGGQTLPSAVGRILTGSATGVPPPFFVGTNGHNAEVYNSRTGKIVARIASPKGTSIQDAAATGDDRTFVIAAVSQAACETLFYQARLTAEGRVASMTPLSVPRVHGHIGFPTALFASADGRVLAYAAATCPSHQSGGPVPVGHGDHGWIGVVDLATGKVRTWPAQPLKLNALALSPTGRTIAFTYGGPESSLRMLPADAPPGPAVQRSRAVRDIPTGQFSIGFSPAGTAILAYVSLGKNRGSALVAYETATGRLLGVVHRWPKDGAGPLGGFSVASSGFLLAYPFNRRIAMRIDLATGRAAWVPTRNPNFGGFPNAIAY